MKLKRIVKLDVNRVDIVPEGANSEAFITIVKGKETKGLMDFEKIMESMKTEDADVIRAEIAKAKAEVPEATATEIAKLKGDVDDLTGKLETANESIAKSKPEPTEEEIMKSASPEIRAAYEKMKKSKDAAELVAKEAMEAEEERVAKERSSSLSNLPLSDEEAISLAKGLSEEHFTLIENVAKAFKADGAGLLDELGSSATEDNVAKAKDAWTKIEKAAKDIAERDGITIEKAMSTAIRENKELYKVYVDGGAE